MDVFFVVGADLFVDVSRADEIANSGGGRRRMTDVTVPGGWARRRRERGREGRGVGLDVGGFGRENGKGGNRS